MASRRDTSPDCALRPVGGIPRLPALTGLAMTRPVRAQGAAAVQLASQFVGAGVARVRDWTPDASPEDLVERALGRTVAHLNRRLSERVSITAFVRRWADVLEEVCEDTTASSGIWALGMHADETYRLRVAPLVATLGESATALVLSRLYYAVPFCVGCPEDLEWIIDGWRSGIDEGGSDAEGLWARADEAAAVAERIETLLRRGSSASLDVIGPRHLRQLVALLSRAQRSKPAADDRAWRATEGVEWGLPHPVVHLVWDDGCPLDHALDEAEYLRGQDEGFPMPQDMWLADTRQPGAADRAVVAWLHALRHVRIALRLIDTLEALAPARAHSR